MESTSDCNVIVKVLSIVLTRLIDSNDQAATGQHLITKFQSSYMPEVSICGYLERIKKYARCSDCCFVIALIYIDRLIESRNVALTKLNVHRLIITSLMLSAKFFDDLFYNNAFYAKLGGVAIGEINSLELELLSLMNFSLFVSTEQFDKYHKELQCYASVATVPTAACIHAVPLLSWECAQVPVVVVQADVNNSTQDWFDTCATNVVNGITSKEAAAATAASMAIVSQNASQLQQQGGNPFFGSDYAFAVQQQQQPLIGIRCPRVDTLFSSSTSSDMVSVTSKVNAQSIQQRQQQQLMEIARTASPEDRLLGHYPQNSDDNTRFSGSSSVSHLQSTGSGQGQGQWAHRSAQHQQQQELHQQLQQQQQQQQQQQFVSSDDFARAYAAAAAASLRQQAEDAQSGALTGYTQNNTTVNTGAVSDRCSWDMHRRKSASLQLQIYDSPTGHLELAQTLSARSGSGSSCGLSNLGNYISPASAQSQPPFSYDQCNRVTTPAAAAAAAIVDSRRTNSFLFPVTPTTSSTTTTTGAGMNRAPTFTGTTSASASAQFSRETSSSSASLLFSFAQCTTDASADDMTATAAAADGRYVSITSLPFGHVAMSTTTDDQMYSYQQYPTTATASAVGVDVSMLHECGSTADMSLGLSARQQSMSSVSSTSSLASMNHSMSQRSVSQAAALYSTAVGTATATAASSQQSQVQTQHFLLHRQQQQQLQQQQATGAQYSQYSDGYNIADTDDLLASAMDTAKTQTQQTQLQQMQQSQHLMFGSLNYAQQLLAQQQQQQQMQQQAFYNSQMNAAAAAMQQQQQVYAACEQQQQQQSNRHRLHELHHLQQQQLAQQQQEYRMESQRRSNSSNSDSNPHQLYLQSQTQTQSQSQSQYVHPSHYHNNEHQLLQQQQQQQQYCNSNMTPNPAADSGDDDLKRSSSAYWNMSHEYKLTAGGY